MARAAAAPGAAAAARAVGVAGGEHALLLGRVGIHERGIVGAELLAAGAQRRHLVGTTFP